MEHVIIDMPSSQPQHSSDSMPNNNGNNRSLASTGVGAQEKFVPITALLEMGASRLGVLVCGWVVLMLVQGGIVVTMETKDRVSITVLLFLVCFRCWRYFYPQDTGSLTEATQSLSADNIQQLVLPIGFIKRLFYWWNLVSVMTCVVLSMKRLASQDFGRTEVANKGARNFALNVFYGLALAEALVLLFSFTFVPIMAMLRKVTEALIEWVKIWFVNSADSESTRPSQLGIGPVRSELCPSSSSVRVLQQNSDEQCRLGSDSAELADFPPESSRVDPIPAEFGTRQNRTLRVPDSQVIRGKTEEKKTKST